MSSEYWLKCDVHNAVVAFWREAQQKFGFKNPYPTVDFTLTGTVAGKARNGDEIKVNMALLKNNKEDYLKNTIGHELVHNIIHIIFNGNARAHGKEWKRAMVKMGLTPSRTHNYSLQGIIEIYPYKCDCKVWELTKNRHKKCLNGAFYRCPKCKARLVKSF